MCIIALGMLVAFDILHRGVKQGASSRASRAIAERVKGGENKSGREGMGWMKRGCVCMRGGCGWENGGREREMRAWEVYMKVREGGRKQRGKGSLNGVFDVGYT